MQELNLRSQIGNLEHSHYANDAWCEMRDSNSQPLPWQGGVLTIELISRNFKDDVEDSNLWLSEPP